MGLEAATFISGLVTSNPLSGDQRSQGDDHLRLLKTVLQSTFPNASKAFYLPDAASKSANFTVVATEMNKTFYVDTTAGAVTATLPTLAAGDAGWECHFIKTNTGTNPLFVAPASGTLQSGEVAGLSKCRRCIPGHRSTAVWTGVAWFVSRVPSAPVGSCIEFHGATLPVGYEWPNGQTLALASTNYPEFNAVIGSGVTADKRGRVSAGKDDMGGVAAGRLSTQITGTLLHAVGGVEQVTLTVGQLPAVTPAGTITITDNHFHFVVANVAASSSVMDLDSLAQNLNVGTSFSYALGSTATVANVGKTSGSQSPPTASFSGTPFGSGQAHSNLQPTIVENFILVVE